MIATAFVKIWNNRVGAIAWDDAIGVGSFEFESSFLKNNWDLAPLKMPLPEAKGRIFSFSELKNDPAFKGLPGLIADVLPDKYGNALIDAWLSRNGRPSGSMNPVETLCFIGKRGMGALEFEPPEPKGTNTATKIEINDLVQIANDILTGRKSFSTNLSADEEKALLAILKIGTSAGGARAKAVIAFNPVTKEVRSGQAEAPKGFTHWLIKFDGVTDTQFGATHGYGRVEMAYHLMAQDAEIEMTECRLLEENGRAHFMTRRFDREPGKGKIHLQSFCAMQHYDFNDVNSYSYEQMFETMRILGLPYPQAEQLFRRMVFNVISRNCDDHTKNFAFVMDKTGVWKLSPAFDVCHSYRPGSTWVSQQSLSVNGKRKDITRDDFLSVAKKMNIKKAENIVNQINKTVQNWKHYATQVDVSPELTGAIQKTLINETQFFRT
ncbi:MAG: type II toxin-antitoxin system HipA family toxin [Bacteroidetes bacterium]|nr:type II toxin-antitoxin system HipA family toxin [Bacteroidota bacterium]